LLLIGKKGVKEGSKALSLPKKSTKATFSLAALASVKGPTDAYPLILPASTRGLHFAIEEQKTWYEDLATRNTSE